MLSELDGFLIDVEEQRDNQLDLVRQASAAAASSSEQQQQQRAPTSSS